MNTKVIRYKRLSKTQFLVDTEVGIVYREYPTGNVLDKPDFSKSRPLHLLDNTIANKAAQKNWVTQIQQ